MGEPNSLKARLCVEGNSLLYGFAESNNIDYLNCGKLVVGHNNKDLKKLEKLLENGEKNEVKDLRLLSHQEAEKIQPKIKCQDALWVPSTGIIDSHGVISTRKRGNF